VLSWARAQRLARRAAVRGGDGQRSLLSRRAWRVLTAHGDRGNDNAFEAVLASWLTAPDDELWDALHRWRSQEALAAVYLAATQPERAAASRAVIGEFCARHGLAPDDEVQRALFYVLSGQSAQHRAADPDGVLLATGYQAANLATRAALRAALATAGDADLIWATASAVRRARARPLTGEESEYLIRELVRLGDWSRLWQFVNQLPLASAVTTMRRFAGGWHPDSEPERALFGLLARADPGELARARDALTDWSVTRVQFAHELCHGGAVSADGRRLAVVRRERPGDSVTVSVHELPWATVGGRMRHEPVSAEAAASTGLPREIAVTFAGDTLIVARTGRPAQHPDAVLLRYAGADFEPLAGLQATLGESVICGLVPCFDPPGGFAIVCENFVAFCHGDGTLARRMPVSLRPAHGTAGQTLADVDPGGRVAIAGSSGGSDWSWAVHEASSGRVLASAPAEECWGIRFIGPGRLVTAERSQLRLWQLAGSGADLAASAPMDLAWNPAIVPSHNRISVQGIGAVYILDAATLDVTGVCGVIGGGADRDALKLGFRDDHELLTAQWNSPGNRAWVTAGKGFADVFLGRHMVNGIADLRPAEWLPADLATVRAALADPALAPAALPLLDLLRAGLEARFGADVRIGAPPVPLRPDDIGIPGPVGGSQ